MVRCSAIVTTKWRGQTKKHKCKLNVIDGSELCRIHKEKITGIASNPEVQAGALPLEIWDLTLGTFDLRQIIILSRVCRTFYRLLISDRWLSQHQHVFLMGIGEDYYLPPRQWRCENKEFAPYRLIDGFFCKIEQQPDQKKFSVNILAYQKTVEIRLDGDEDNPFFEICNKQSLRAFAKRANKQTIEILGKNLEIKAREYAEMIEVERLFDQGGFWERMRVRFPRADTSLSFETVPLLLRKILEKLKTIKRGSHLYYHDCQLVVMPFHLTKVEFPDDS